MSKIITKTLIDGPMQGETVEIHEENLKINPKLNVTGSNGEVYLYMLNDNNEFSWIKNAEDINNDCYFHCDDDGKIISKIKHP